MSSARVGGGADDRLGWDEGSLTEIIPVSAMRGLVTGGHYTNCWLVGFD